MASFWGRHGNVYVYIPNLIGYARIACSLYAFAVAFSQPLACVGWYFLGFICDELDGRAARTFSQTSTLGAVLDMVTDRVATSCLLTILCMLYPRLHMGFIMLLMLDIFSHWFQMYSTLLAGSHTHKDVRSRSLLVRFYYSNRIFMGFCCIACEVMYLSLYLMAWPRFSAKPLVTLALPPGPVTAQLAGLGRQLATAVPATGQLVGLLSRPVVLSAPAVVALLALPGVAIKQICNWVQLRNAMQGLVEYDRAQERAVKQR